MEAAKSSERSESRRPRLELIGAVYLVKIINENENIMLDP
jgi:hypothetical protein